MNNLYKLSAEANPDKVFLVNRSELEGRIDTDYYKPSIKNRIETIIKRRAIKLSSKIKKLETGFNNSQNTDGLGVPFIRTQNIRSVYLKLTDINYTDDLNVRIPPKNSLLFTRIGVGVGDVSINKDGGYAISDNVISATFDSELFAKYVNIYLGTSLGAIFLNREKRDTARAIISYENIKNIIIPNILDSVQQQIVDIYQEAYEQKQQKEAEAKALLDSIDDYLLGELGITLPEKDNSLEKRVFIKQFCEVAGGRFDPDYNCKLEYLLNQKANFEYLFLKDLIIKSPQYGANEEAIDGNSQKDVRYIRITDINEYGILKEDGFKTAKNTDTKYLLNYNDLLFARSGSVGRCYIHKKNNLQSIFAGYLIRFVINSDKANPDFLFYFCNSKIYRFWVSAIERPAVQSNINSEEFKSLPIPLPPLDKQNEIAEHIQGIRQRAKQLQEEAKTLLEEAKQKVEQMILG